MRWRLAFACVSVIVAAGLIGLALLWPKSNGCTGHGQTLHRVVISHGVVYPETTDANLCDELSFTNNDASLRLIAFGPHEDHQPYDGVTERLLGQGQSFTIRLNQAGTYYFHDHLQDAVRGSFNVSRLVAR